MSCRPDVGSIIHCRHYHQMLLTRLLHLTCSTHSSWFGSRRGVFQILCNFGRDLNFVLSTLLRLALAKKTCRVYHQFFLVIRCDQHLTLMLGAALTKLLENLVQPPPQDVVAAGGALQRFQPAANLYQHRIAPTAPVRPIRFCVVASSLMIITGNVLNCWW